MFNFWNMIESNGQELKLLNAQYGSGWNDNGDPIKAETSEQSTFIGVLTPLSRSDLEYAEEGTFTKRDRRLYTTTRLPYKQKFEADGLTYTIQEEIPYGYQTDVYIYIARGQGSEPR